MSQDAYDRLTAELATVSARLRPSANIVRNSPGSEMKVCGSL